MNKKLKSLLALSMTVLMTGSVLIGCGKSKDNGGDKVTKGEEGQIAYPIKTDTKLNYWLPINANVSSVKKNLGETEFAKELEKKTGIKVEYVHPVLGQEKEQFNLRIASGDLPDIVEYAWTTFPGGPDKALADKNIIKLNEYIDKYAPNLKKYLKENPEIDKMCKTDNGDYYMFPFLRGDKVLTTYYGPALRKDWLDELGLPVPETIDEWETTLKAFKEKKGATAPLTFNFKEFFSAFSGAFGVDYGGDANSFYVEGGKVKYGPTEDGFKKFTETFNRWYKEGLLDNNFASADKKIVSSNMLSGKSGAALAYIGGDLGKWIPAIKEKDSKADFVMAPYPVAKKGEKPKFGQMQFQQTGQGVAISSNCKDIVTAVRYLDYGYSKEGIDLYNYGIKDVSFKEENGKKAYTDLITKNPEKLSMPVAMSVYMRTYSGPFIQEKEYIDNYYQMDEQKQAAKILANSDADKYKLPFISPKSDEISELAKVENEVGTYVDEMFLKFVMGTEPISNYDKFQDQIKKLNIEKALKIKQDALERFNKR